jgi:hypothetical protein
MFETGSDPDIEARRFNVAEVSENDTDMRYFSGKPDCTRSTAWRSRRRPSGKVSIFTSEKLFDGLLVA